MDWHPGQPPDDAPELYHQMAAVRQYTDHNRDHLQQSASATAVFVIGDDEDDDMDSGDVELVSPKPIITTVTKQAEISPTERFAVIRKLSVATQSTEVTQTTSSTAFAGSNVTYHHSSSSQTNAHQILHGALNSAEPLIIYNKVENSKILTEGYLCDSQVEYMKSEVSDEAFEVHEHLIAASSRERIANESSRYPVDTAASHITTYASQYSAPSTDNQLIDTQVSRYDVIKCCAFQKKSFFQCHSHIH